MKKVPVETTVYELTWFFDVTVYSNGGTTETSIHNVCQHEIEGDKLYFLDRLGNRTDVCFDLNMITGWKYR